MNSSLSQSRGKDMKTLEKSYRDETQESTDMMVQINSNRASQSEADNIGDGSSEDDADMEEVVPPEELEVSIVDDNFGEWSGTYHVEIVGGTQANLQENSSYTTSASAHAAFVQGLTDLEKDQMSNFLCIRSE